MSQDKPDSSWGGARAGSGRQSLGKLPSKQIGFKLPGEVTEQLEALREGKESVNAVARRLMYERLEQLQEEHAKCLKGRSRALFVELTQTMLHTKKQRSRFISCHEAASSVYPIIFRNRTRAVARSTNA